MANMQKIYEDMKKNNILGNADFLKRMLEVYKKSSRPYGSTKDRDTRRSDFYDELTKPNNNNLEDKSKVNMKDYQKFYVMMTNKWIKNVLSMTESELAYYDKHNYSGYRIIRNILLNHPQVNSLQDIAEIYALMEQKIDSFELKDKKYFWRLTQTSFGFNQYMDYAADFIHIDSRYGNVRRTNRIDVEYRLYVNCANEDIFKLVGLYVENCEKLGIPYYFKFQTDGKRQDKFLVYCSGKELKNNIGILENIAKSHPEIVEHCGKGLDLIGNIDNWIGLASEPNNSSLKHHHSFNTLRSEILEDAAEELTLDFIDENINKEVNIDGVNKKFNNILLEFAIKKIVEEIARKEKLSVFQISNEQLINSIKRDLISSFNGTRRNNIRQSFYRLREVIPQKNELIATNDAPIFYITLPDGKKFGYSINLADRVTKEVVNIMEKCDPNYIEKYKNKIKEKCRNYGVDAENFALNSDSLEQFKKIDSIPSKVSNNEIINKSQIDNSLLESLSMSEPIAKYLIRNGIDINNLPSAFLSNVNGTKEARKNEFDYTLTWGNYNYRNTSEMMISIKDIIGSCAFDGQQSLISRVSGMYNNKDAYGQRGLDFLYKSLENNIDRILNLSDPIRLIELEGKYYVSQDGNHRVHYLLLAYHVAMEKYKNDPAKLRELEEKFRIKASVTRKTGNDLIDKICYCMSKCGNDDIKLKFDSDSLCTMIVNGNVYEIKTEKDFIERFEAYLFGLDKGADKFGRLNDMLDQIGYSLEVLDKIKNEKANLENVGIQNSYSNIMEKINPVLLKIRAKLPNGVEIPARQYLEEVVMPLIPKGLDTITLQNGARISLVQFLEEMALGDCQETYNGDIVKYLTEKTVGLVETDELKNDNVVVEDATLIEMPKERTRRKMMVFSKTGNMPYYRIEVKPNNIELSYKDENGTRIANTFEDKQGLLFIMRNIDEQGFTRMVEDNKEIAEYVASFGGTMKIFVDRLRNKKIRDDEVVNLMSELDSEEIKKVPKFDNSPSVFTTQRLKSLIEEQGEDYYASFCSNPWATMKSLNFYDLVEEFVEEYLVGKLSSMIGDFVDEVSVAQGDINKIGDSRGYLYRQFEDLLPDMRRNLSQLFINPMDDVQAMPDEYIDVVMGFISNAGYEYLESISQSVSENIFEEKNNNIGLVG